MLRRIPRTLATALVAILIVAACNSSPVATTQPPTSSPVALASPTVGATTSAPSATPPDAGTAFLAQMAAANKAQLSVQGTVDLGTQEGQVSGSILYVAGDTSQTMTITIAGVSTTNASVHVGSKRYAKAGDGPWLEDLSPVTETPGLSSFLAKLPALADRGPEVHDGQATDRLELPAGTAVDPAIFGLTAPSMSSPTASVVFYAMPDGRPVAIDVTAAWTQAVSGASVPVKMTLDLAFVEIGGNVLVTAPADVWQRFASNRYHYRIAHEGDWDVSTSEKGYDVFTSAEGPSFIGTRYASHGLPLSVVAKDVIAYDKAHEHATNVGNAAFSLAGKPARLLTFHLTITGVQMVLYEVLAVKGGYVYDLGWASPRGNDVPDLATFKEMLTTFAFA